MNSEEQCIKSIKKIRSSKNSRYSGYIPVLISWEECQQEIPKTKSIQNTLKYIFYKVGVGLFVQIKSNKIDKFVIFNNVNFENEFHDKIKLKEGDIEKYFIEKGDKHKVKGLMKDKRRWRANNCLIKVLKDYSLNEIYYEEFRSMLEGTLKHHKIKDTAFFVNRKDFPILKINGTEPYDHLYGPNTPLLSHKYDQYTPIYTLSSNPALFQDKLVPTDDCWKIITNKYYPPGCKNSYTFDKSVIAWDKKKQVAVFRGSATGCYTDLRNPRLMISKINQDWSKTGSKYKGWIDAGVHKGVKKDKKTVDSPYLTRVDLEKLGIKPLAPISMKEQKGYKYVFDIEGNVSAYRFGALLSFGSVILRVESDYKMWIDQFLKPKVHYIPIKRDFSDLVAILKWCHTHDEACQRLAANARRAYERYFNKPFVYKYLDSLLNEKSNKNKK